jgi:uncharacterized phiE125 gp8 family phage protein
MLTDLNPPPAEPITLAEAKAFLRVDHDDEDTLLQTLILAAREQLEAHLNIAMITRPMRLAVTCGGALKLPRWPIVSLDEVTADGVSTRDYTANLRARPAFVSIPANGPIEIAFTAGYGPSPDDVPAPLRQAMLLLIAQGFEHRDDDAARLPLMVDALTMPYRVVRL